MARVKIMISDNLHYEGLTAINVFDNGFTTGYHIHDGIRYYLKSIRRKNDSNNSYSVFVAIESPEKLVDGYYWVLDYE